VRRRLRERTPAHEAALQITSLVSGTGLQGERPDAQVRAAPASSEHRNVRRSVMPAPNAAQIFRRVGQLMNEQPCDVFIVAV
jgi:hypothetical protein